MKKALLLTSNQPRHLSLRNLLADIFDYVYVVHECTTVFPGNTNDFYKASEIMQNYFSNVIKAETKIFGEICFSTPKNVSYLNLKMGDLNKVPLHLLEQALDSDIIINFGSSFIKSPLVERLIEKQCINIHMGISPFFRGSSCNFWAIYDGYPGLVGATVHYLSKGLDSGPIVFHSLPPMGIDDPFILGMEAVKSVQLHLVEKIKNNSLFGIKPVLQNNKLQIRNSKYSDFTDEVVKNYMENIKNYLNFEKTKNYNLFDQLVNPCT